MGMNWIKTADRLPEDMPGKEILVSWSAHGMRWCEVVTRDAGEYVSDDGHSFLTNTFIDYWCEIELPE
jgi:hypothetical protein